ncbi:MAG: substrate-binding domain-containing protein [Christensenella sp.]|uniref:substrate-binding domain-containing protein n=1 Tax=Christensenella sp. TaxID=1935934 RepID=UPI002B1F3E3C|nr:substrate-binding domain-containing protein [Christensenella sp.]MEA5001925.1 substrate-binding domain-containing protein [Christensenella sp.]
MKKTVGLILAVMLVLTCIAGCTAPAAQSSAPAESSAPATEASAAPTEAGTESSAPAQKASIDLPDMETPNEWVVRFDGVEPVSVNDFKLTDEQAAKIKEGKLTAALVMHTTGESYSAAVVDGATKAAEELGIEIVAQTNCDWKAEQQATDLESVLALNPDIVIIMQVDVEAMTQQLKGAQANGTSMVYFDNINANLAEEDYVSLVTTNTYGAGMECAKDMAQQLGGEGKIAMFSWTAPNLGNKARDQGFRDYIEKNFPNIEIVTQEGYTEATDCAALADGVFAKYPDLDGAYAQWDVPAEGVISSAKSVGLGDDFAVTCVDLGYNVARIMAEGGMVKGIGAQQPYSVGYHCMIAGALDAVDESVPKMVLIDPINVTQETLAESWPVIYNQELPSDIASLMK